MKIIDLINKGKELEAAVEQKQKAYANACLLDAPIHIQKSMLHDYRVAFRNYQTYIVQEVKE